MEENRFRSTPPRFNKNVTFTLAALTLIFVSLSVFLALRSGLLYTLLIKIGLKEDVPVNKDPYASWTNCLFQLNLDVDVVFIGDSITAKGDFQSLISDKTVCNLGCYGDQIWDVTARIGGVKAVKPEKLFIMIGTNTLACRSLDQSIRSYSAMADKYVSTFPDCDIIFLSVLPVTTKSEQGARTNENIMKFNTFIQTTAEERNATYVDLFSVYELSGALNPAYTDDGLHITSDAYTLWVDAIADQLK